MLTQSFIKALAAFATVNLAAAQTFTDCDPLEKTCPPEPAVGRESIDCDFSAGECAAFDSLPGTSLTYEKDGARFRINKEGDGPTIATHKRIFFGRVDVELRAAPGVGIVTCIVLESSDLDEIDWEFLGGDDFHVQSNYFGKGDTSSYDRVGLHDVDSPTQKFHTYSIEATPEYVSWMIDGAEVRRLNREEAQGGSRFPQTPFEVKLGTWVAGGEDSPEGTVEWAGGYTEFDQAPFDAHYKRISIIDYGGGDSPTSANIKEYVYGDNSGDSDSIKIVKGDAHDDEDLKTSATASSTKTKTADEESTKTKTEEESTKTESEDSTETTSEATETESGSSETTMNTIVTTSGSDVETVTSTTSGHADHSDTVEPTSSATSTDDSEDGDSPSETGSDGPSETGGSGDDSGDGDSGDAEETSPPSAAAHGIVSFANMACAGAFLLAVQLL